jgi:uncharacterized protein (TIGR02757 family)
VNIEKKDLKDFLDSKVNQYNNPNFIETDPISIPHRFALKEDIEISGFLVATISWGNRKMIVKNGIKMVGLMGESPYDFIMSATERDLRKFDLFVHRTFNASDIKYFLIALRNIYEVHGGLEHLFYKFLNDGSMKDSIHHFRKVFFELNHPLRTEKHISDPYKGSAAKKINMFLRWVVRNDNKGVDFGIWKSIHSNKLSCPLDVHSGRVARKLNMLQRTQDDWKAVEELDSVLRDLDALDPVKYDFALFGLGVFENF